MKEEGERETQLARHTKQHNTNTTNSLFNSSNNFITSLHTLYHSFHLNPLKNPPSL